MKTTRRMTAKLGMCVLVHPAHDLVTVGHQTSIFLWHKVRLTFPATSLSQDKAREQWVERIQSIVLPIESE